MAYAQWVVIIITNSSTKKVVIKNVKLPWGKFHKDNDKDSEVEIEDIEGKEIPAGKEYKINSCGREQATAGTEGDFDVYEDDDKVRHFYWECPWGSKTNTWRVSEINKKWIVEDRGANLNSGALGNITVDLYKKEKKES